MSFSFEIQNNNMASHDEMEVAFFLETRRMINKMVWNNTTPQPLRSMIEKLVPKLMMSPCADLWAIAIKSLDRSRHLTTGRTLSLPERAMIDWHKDSVAAAITSSPSSNVCQSNVPSSNESPHVQVPQVQVPETAMILQNLKDATSLHMIWGVLDVCVSIAATRRGAQAFPIEQATVMFYLASS